MPGQPQAAVSVSFLRPLGGSESADVPDLLDLTLDKAAYATGERLKSAARAEIRRHGDARGGGERTASTTSATSPSREAGTTVDIPVKAEWGSGAYLVATGLPAARSSRQAHAGRALDSRGSRSTRRSAGLSVSLEAPEKARPRAR